MFDEGELGLFNEVSKKAKTNFSYILSRSIYLINVYIFVIRLHLAPFPSQSSRGNAREGICFFDAELIGIMRDLIMSFSSNP